MIFQPVAMIMLAGCPVFGPPEVVQYQGADLDIGYAAAPLYTDWDNDGLEDMIVGTRFTSGEFAGPCGGILFFPNSGTPEQPQFESWEFLYADGDTIETQT